MFKNLPFPSRVDLRLASIHLFSLKLKHIANYKQQIEENANNLLFFRKKLFESFCHLNRFDKLNVQIYDIHLFSFENWKKKRALP